MIKRTTKSATNCQEVLAVLFYVAVAPNGKLERPNRIQPPPLNCNNSVMQ